MRRTEDGNILAEFPEPGAYRLILDNGEVKEAKVWLPGDYVIDGEWILTFPKDEHQARKTLVSELFPWNESEDPEIR